MKVKLTNGEWSFLWNLGSRFTFEEMMGAGKPFDPSLSMHRVAMYYAMLRYCNAGKFAADFEQFVSQLDAHPADLTTLENAFAQLVSEYAELLNNDGGDGGKVAGESATATADDGKKKVSVKN